MYLELIRVRGDRHRSVCREAGLGTKSVAEKSIFQYVDDVLIVH